MADAPGPLVEVLLAALAVVLIYFLYGMIYRAFQRVGFTNSEATLILLGTTVGSLIDVPLGRFGGWSLAINVGGAIVPLAVSFVLLRRFPEMREEAIVGVTVTSFVAYLVTTPTSEGIVSPFPYWIAPALSAALLSLVAFWKDETHAAPLAYVSGSLGALVGGDLFHLDELVSLPPPEGSSMGSIGGAAVFDMIFLTGILAVLLDMFFFREKARYETPTPSHPLVVEGVVFTSSTPSRFISEYRPFVRSAGTSSTPPTPREESSSERLGRHLEWEEKVRRGSP